MRHETPSEVASILAKHVPRNVESILDPCVGRGALLEPIVQRFANKSVDVTCVDIDVSVTRFVKRRFSCLVNGKLSVHACDFIDWGNRCTSQYDCVVMNPPFFGKKTDWRNITGMNFGFQKKAPVEGEFIRLALTLLKPNGVLLGIIPSSVVCGASLSWLRKILLSDGSIKYIHELPSYCFSGIEGRMYILVYKKKRSKSDIVLLNHDLYTPEKLTVPQNDLGKELRFDFAYHHATQSLTDLEDSTPELAWSRLGDLMDVCQGFEKSPKGTQSAIHTIDYKNCFWNCGRKLVGATSQENKYLANSSCILVSRIGRNCSKSFGVAISHKPVPCTDHVWIMKMKEPAQHLQILFSIRCLVHLSWFSSILERGVGAKYIVSHDLADLRIPMKLGSKHHGMFTKYEKAFRSYEGIEMQEIEKNTCVKLLEMIQKRKNSLQNVGH